MKIVVPPSLNAFYLTFADSWSLLGHHRVYEQYRPIATAEFTHSSLYTHTFLVFQGCSLVVKDSIYVFKYYQYCKKQNKCVFGKNHCLGSLHVQCNKRHLKIFLNTVKTKMQLNQIGKVTAIAVDIYTINNKPDD